MSRLWQIGAGVWLISLPLLLVLATLYLLYEGSDAVSSAMSEGASGSEIPWRPTNSPRADAECWQYGYTYTIVCLPKEAK